MQHDDRRGTQRPRLLLETGVRPVAIAAKPRTQQLFVANQEDPFLTYVDVAAGSAAPSEDIGSGSFSVVYHQEIDAVVVATLAGAVAALDPRVGRVLRTSAVYDEPLMVHPHSDTAVILTCWRRVCLFDVNLFQVRREVAMEGTPVRVLGLGGGRVVVHSYGRTVRADDILSIVDIDAGMVVTQAPIARSVRSLAVDRGLCRIFATIDPSGELRVFDFDLRLLSSYMVGDNPVELALIDAGSTLCVDRDQSITFMDPLSMHILNVLPRVYGWVRLEYDASAAVLYVMNLSTLSIEVIDLHLREVVATMSSGIERTGLTVEGATLFDQENRTLIIASAGSSDSTGRYLGKGIVMVFDALQS